MFKASDFKVEKRAGGWSVVRSDGAIIALGFATKKEAQDWWGREADLVFAD